MKYNIILITVDCLRADHLSCYGYNRQTPNIDKLAKQGILFKNAISQSSWTKSSMGSLFTSIYPHNHTAMDKADVLPDDTPNFIKLLKDNCYYTIGIHANPFLKSDHKFNQGFDFYRFYRNASSKTLINKLSLKHDKFFAYLHLMDLHLPYSLQGNITLVIIKAS